MKHPQTGSIDQRPATRTPESWGVDLERAIQCVELAQLSYRSPDEASNLALGRFGYRSFECLSRREGRDYLMVVEDEVRLVVAVRGTDDYRDWLTNIKLWYRDSPFGRVHQGYYQVAREFLPELSGLLERLGPKPIVLTGHSMGGAVATLLATALAQQDGCIQGMAVAFLADDFLRNHAKCPGSKIRRIRIIPTEEKFYRRDAETQRKTKQILFVFSLRLCVSAVH